MKVLQMILGFLVVFAITAMVMAAIGYLFLMVVPCDWFGSGPEGACGYKAVFWTVLAGFASTCGIAIWIVMRVTRDAVTKKNSTDKEKS